MEVDKGLLAFFAEEEGAVGVVGALAGKVAAGGLVEAGGEGVGAGVATGGVGAPAGGIVPAVAPAGGVGVNGDVEHVVLAQAPAVVAHAAAALGQRDVGLFGDEEGGDDAG